MIRASDIHKLSDFQQHATAHLDRLAREGTTEVLTINGEARGVVMAPATFDELVSKAAMIDSLAMIDRGMEEAKAGQGEDLREAIRGISNQLGLQPGV